MAPEVPPGRIGWVGTGFIIKEAMQVAGATLGARVGRVLTRRPLDSIEGFDRDTLTQSVDELIEHSDVVFEATGDPLHATVVIEKALEAGKPVVTMNSEFHVTTGSFFHGKGFVTEAQGDQPGATAQMHDDAVGMGFTPLAYVNIKGFLNPNPPKEDMIYWSERQKLSLPEVISFTDGTKLQIEQALCANGLGADIAQEGLIGGKREDIFDTDHLVEAARKLGRPISDYVVAPGAPPGVFVLADHPAYDRLPFYGPYQKLRTKGDSAYLILRAYHLCGLEVAKSLRDVLMGKREVLLTNGPEPRVSLAAVAKRKLEVGETLHRAIGCFEVRGACVRTAEHPNHIPIGLLDGATLKRAVEPEQKLTFDDVDVPPSRALEIWNTLRDRAVASAAQTS
ncbi:MAG: NAD(P)-dependent oxidoreductase [Myxococcota bacterium]